PLVNPNSPEVTVNPDSPQAPPVNPNSP
uniref:Uncharacterized protein n=1 Tax=Myotis lucifugus TaxID=59463 RepID=G1Q0Q8_MYOLU